MPGKKSFWKRLAQSKMLQVLFCVVCIVLIFCIYSIGLRNIKNNKIEQKIAAGEVIEDNSVLYSLEAKEEKGNINFSGWAMRSDAVNKEICIVLKDVDSEENIIIPTKLVSNAEVANYFNPTWEYGNIGIDANISKNKLSGDKCYEIILYLDCVRKIPVNEVVVDEEYKKNIVTNLYLYNGEVMPYNPRNLVLPDIADAECKNLIESSELKAFNLENRIWIYKNQKQLICIMNPEFGLLSEAQIKVPVMAKTSYVNHLPKERRKYGFDHLGSYSEETTFCREGILPYQVIIIDLPESYPITYITTGYHNSLTEEWEYKMVIPIME